MATPTIAAPAKPVSLLEPGLLTVVIARDDHRFSARCLELDLITEMDTPEEALADLLSMMQEYAADYQRRRELFARSPNRAHHRPYVEAILRCRDEWELRELLTDTPLSLPPRRSIASRPLRHNSRG